MINVDDIHSLSDFQRNTKAHMERLKATGGPEVLTVNGKAELVVLSASAYQDMAERIEQAEAIAGIRKGLSEAQAGKGKPVRQAVESLRKKHRIPRSS